MARGIVLRPGYDALRQAVARVNSGRGLLRELGYATSNGLTAALLRERAELLGGDTSHFWRRPAAKLKPKSIRRSCGREYEYVRSRGCTRSVCNPCKVNDRRFAVKVRIVTFHGGKCADCGYSACLAALHAHHVDAADKDFSLSGAHARSWQA